MTSICIALVESDAIRSESKTLLCAYSLLGSVIIDVDCVWTEHSCHGWRTHWRTRMCSVWLIFLIVL